MCLCTFIYVDLCIFCLQFACVLGLCVSCVFVCVFGFCGLSFVCSVYDFESMISVHVIIFGGSYPFMYMCTVQ